MAEDIQQQIADGARPLARVGDVIAHGKAIPANVVRVKDRSADRWVRATRGRWALYEYRGEPNSDGTARDGTELSTQWGPLTVVEVDPEPEPQPAEPESMTCWSTSAHVAHEWSDARGAWYCTGKYPESAAQKPAERRLIGPPHAHLDRPCTDACSEPSEPVEISQHCQGCGNWMPPPAVHKATCPTRIPQPASDAETMQILGERDDAIDWADRLAQAVGEHLGVDIGEHSNANLPWQTALLALQFTPAPESGPVVLSLSEVPDGAVALIGGSSGARYPRTQMAWAFDQSETGVIALGELLDREETVTVEFAPPREPRTWPKLDPTPAWDDVLMVDVEGYGRWELNEDTDLFMPLNGGAEHSLPQLRELGGVREVLDGQ